MKHNQNDEASRKNEKGSSQEKQMPKNQEGNNSEKTGQQGQPHRGHSAQDDQANQGKEKHTGAGKSK
jgi:hypothetical protein